MKIGMMSRWNVPSGQSSHAEPIGRAWLKMGYELKVFAPAGMDISLIFVLGSSAFAIYVHELAI